MTGTPYSTPSVAERIIRARGGAPSYGHTSMHNDEDRYEAFLVTGGYPQLGFSVFCRNGRRHGFLFHNLENLDLIDRAHGQYLSFTHRGKAVTLRGRGLHAVFDALLDHTLQAVYEYQEAVWPQPNEEESIIERIDVTALPGMQPTRQSARILAC